MKKRGFTLIELLVVVAIISLLSSVVFASLNTARVKARNAKRLSDLNQIRLSLYSYAADPSRGNGSFPNIPSGTSSISWSSTLQTALAPELPTLPNDPLGTANGPTIYRWYLYWPNAQFSSWAGWSTYTGCDGKNVLMAYATNEIPTTSVLKQECSLPGLPVITMVLN